MTRGQGPAGTSHAALLRAALACALAWISVGRANAQALTPDLLRPVQGDFAAAQDIPLQKKLPNPNGLPDPNRSLDPDADEAKRKKAAAIPAPSRIGKIPTYGVPAASGASDDGFDSRNRRRQKPKRFPAAPRPPVPAGPGSPIVILPPPDLPPPREPRPPSATAAKPPVPAAVADRVVGQPYRRQLKPDLDPFGAVGDYAGSFLVKSAVEVSGGYDSNPGRSSVPRGSGFYVVAPEFVAFSDWERHALVADLRGSYTGYGTTFPQEGLATAVPTSVDRPDFTGHIDGRLDVTSETHVLSELRLRVATDNPGSPNVQAGLSRYPVFATTGGSLGLDQSFNRLQITGVGNVDRTVYQNSTLTDGTTSSNDDRNFNQYGGVARVSYDLFPGVKPFGEVSADTRVHDNTLDRFGYNRNSSGGYAKGGTSFELTRLITGEASIGYAARTYDDPRLNKLTGLLTSASLVWSVSGLTTAKLIANTSVDETTLPGVSGILTRTYTAEVDHDFRRWLTGIGKFTYGTLDYQGAARSDKIYSASADLIWKLSRSFWVKGEVRQDRLVSNLPGFSSVSNVVMLGIRVQN